MNMGMFGFGKDKDSSGYPLVAEESVMKQRAHGTSDRPVQDKLKFGCDIETADKICSFNRHYAEFAGYSF